MQNELRGEAVRPAIRYELRGEAARAALVDLQAALLTVANAGGWPALSGQKTLHPGDSGADVEALRARLAVEARARGGVAPERSDAASADAASFDLARGDPATFDADLEAAVRRYQYLHGLEIDGVVGPRTRAALETPIETELARLAVAIRALAAADDPYLTRVGELQNLPAADETPALALGADDNFIEVNIPAFSATLFREGVPVFSTPVVVGRPGRPTPRFTATMTHLIVNPDWTVPPTILRQDVLPALKRDPGYLAAHGLVLLDRDGRQVDSSNVDYHRYSAATFPYIVRQPPCPNHTLGVVKFMFPNQYSVYMHDTNHPELFARAVRAYSSGCIRVARPRALAEVLLQGATPEPAAALEAWIDEGWTRRVDLPAALPVRIVYRTVVVDEAGEVRFLPDIYGLEAARYRVPDGVAPELPRPLGQCPLPVRGWEVE